MSNVDKYREEIVRKTWGALPAGCPDATEVGRQMVVAVHSLLERALAEQREGIAEALDRRGREAWRDRALEAEERAERSEASLREANEGINYWLEQAGQARVRCAHSKAALARVRELHVTDGAPGYAGVQKRCLACSHVYPCPTVRELDGDNAYGKGQDAEDAHYDDIFGDGS